MCARDLRGGPAGRGLVAAYDREVRRLLILVCAIVFLDTSFTSAITPQSGPNGTTEKTMKAEATAM